jgi:CRP/FNR family transcriptional regulator, cyclic AMP receptor protein
MVSLTSGSTDLEWPLAHAPNPLPLPFSVGRRPEWKEMSVDREVSLQLHDDMPFRLSRIHFTIFEENHEVFVRDEISRLGTEVNGIHLGAKVSELRVGGHGVDYVARLNPRDNIVVAGGDNTRFVFHIHVTP